MATYNFLDKTGLGQVWTKIKALIPTKTSDLTNDSGYITTETDPVFSASPAANITTANISSWNAKVSDDKTWNGVILNKGNAYSNNGDIYVPYLDSSSSTVAYTGKATSTPTQGRIAKYDVSAYLYSTTPSTSDNSTKVATTSFVKTALSNITDNNTTYSVSMTNNIITLTGSDGNASSVTLPVYNGGVS